MEEIFFNSLVGLAHEASALENLINSIIKISSAEDTSLSNEELDILQQNIKSRMSPSPKFSYTSFLRMKSVPGAQMDGFV